METATREIRETPGRDRVLCALSGGIDSATVAALVHRAVGRQLTCVFVNHGFMRKGEPQEVHRTFVETFDINLVDVDASHRFLARLSGGPLELQADQFLFALGDGFPHQRGPFGIGLGREFGQRSLVEGRSWK